MNIELVLGIYLLHVPGRLEIEDSLAPADLLTGGHEGQYRETQMDPGGAPARPGQYARVPGGQRGHLLVAQARHRLLQHLEVGVQPHGVDAAGLLAAQQVARPADLEMAATLGEGQPSASGRGPAYDPEGERVIMERLRALGYLE